MPKLMIGKSTCMVGILFTLLFLLSGCGHVISKPGIKAEVMMSAGEEVRLYYTGQQSAKDMFCIDEIVSVYRTEGHKSVEVGKVKIIRELDRQNLEALVVNGKVKKGDEARKAIAACKVKGLMGPDPMGPGPVEPGL